MVRLPLFFIFSSISVLYCFAQEIDSVSTPVDSLSIELNDPLGDTLDSNKTSDSLKVKRRFVSPSIYFDIGKLLTTPTDFETKYEGGIEIKFWEVFPIGIEVGSATLSPNGAFSNGDYESKGSYYRIGAGYVGSYDARHDIGIAFRYGASTFKESGSVFINSPSGAQEDLILDINRENLNAEWWEVGLYSDSQLLKDSDLFRYGIDLRLRILRNYDSQEEVDVYAIPGYGRAFDKTIPSLNFFLKIKF